MAFQDVFHMLLCLLIVLVNPNNLFLSESEVFEAEVLLLAGGTKLILMQEVLLQFLQADFIFILNIGLQIL